MTRPGNRRHDSPAVSIALAINRDGEDTDWHSLAECAKNDPEIWFHPSAEAEAIAICLGCPVRIQCADYALRNREQHGVFGGLTAEQRARILAGSAA